MGSYGIGISRLVGAIIEANHDDKGIIWPDSVSPFDFVIINLKSDDIKCSDLCDVIFQKFSNKGFDVLIDDRVETPGVKLSSMDLIGIPWQIIVGPRGLKNNTIEIKNRKEMSTKELTLEELINKF